MPASPPPRPSLSRVLLRDEALAAIRRSIVDGALAPGQVIKDSALATSLGLSVAPVRSALARLVDEGLVESKPQSHTRVTPVSTAAVRDAVVVVSAMHQIATREASAALTDADLTTMRTANERFDAAVAADDVDAALAADDCLHRVVLDRCGNSAVRATVDRFGPVIRRVERRRTAAAHGTDSVALHQVLIDTCRTDVDVAVAVTTTMWSALLDELTAATAGAGA